MTTRERALVGIGVFIGMMIVMGIQQAVGPLPPATPVNWFVGFVWLAFFGFIARCAR
jgi:hypothetical protein